MQLVIDGNPAEFNFCAYFLKNGQVISAAGMKRSEDLVILNQAMRLNIHSSLSDFKGTKLDLDKLKEKIRSQKGKCACSREKNMSCERKTA